MTDTPYKRKLIEVALPLDEINRACAADKAVKTGTIRNIHKWFAPMPLPAWRALLLAALLDDPGNPEERALLLEVVRRLVVDAPNPPTSATVEMATNLLRRQFGQAMPTIVDPFCGAGSTLVEAQRLGLRTQGSDLNPVPALIARTLTQLLPRTMGGTPVSPRLIDDTVLFPDPDEAIGPFEGIEEDFLAFAKLVEKRARQRVGAAYPVEKGVQPVAWIWGRTIQCPNPACQVDTVLTTSWWLSKKAGELAWIQPRFSEGKVELDVVAGRSTGTAPEPPKPGRGTAFACLACRQVMSEDTVRKLAMDRGLGLRLMAVVEDTPAGRVYRAPSAHDIAATSAVLPPDDLPVIDLGTGNQYVAPPRFGIRTLTDLFLPRQLATLAALADEVAAIHAEVIAAGGSNLWADTVTSLLGLAIGKIAQYGSTQAFLYTRNGPSAAKAAFSRADLPMTWDFTETSPFGESIGSWSAVCTNLVRAFRFVPHGVGEVTLSDARAIDVDVSPHVLVATDPPYFDAIAYADLSDYFYVWHRRALAHVHPDLYRTLAAPKQGELSAFAWHHGGTKDGAREYFIEGFTETFRNISDAPGDLPMLVVYASREQKSGDEETRWSSILSAMLEADLEITGTWPIRGTTEARMRSAGSNAVASYIVMVCRPRPKDAKSTSLGEFSRALRGELGRAVRDLQQSAILPVDLAQAAMGPGMQVFSRHRSVLTQDGKPVAVEQALRIINDALAEVLDEQEGELDPESRFATRWWSSYGWDAASFGEADKTARPLGISVDDVARAGVVTSQANRVQLVQPTIDDLEWTPATDLRPTAWEGVHYLLLRLVNGGGELDAARLMAQLGPLQDAVRSLVYRLHEIALKKGWTSEQERYNTLINSWPELVKLSTSHFESERLF